MLYEYSVAMLFASDALYVYTFLVLDMYRYNI